MAITQINYEFTNYSHLILDWLSTTSPTFQKAPAPSAAPSASPSSSPSLRPSGSPTHSPIGPTHSPSATPTSSPSVPPATSHWNELNDTLSLKQSIHPTCIQHYLHHQITLRTHFKSTTIFTASTSLPQPADLPPPPDFANTLHTCIASSSSNSILFTLTAHPIPLTWGFTLLSFHPAPDLSIMHLFTSSLAPWIPLSIPTTRP